MTDQNLLSQAELCSGVSSCIHLEKSHFRFVIQLVRQVNHGHVESKQYFAGADAGEAKSFIKLAEQDLVQAN